MSKTSYLISIVILSMVFFLSSCNSEESDLPSEEITQDENTDTDTGDASSILCTGNKSDDPLPLAIGNRWYFKKNLGGTNIEIKINETIYINDVAYFKIEFRESSGAYNQSYERYYRKDQNGDVYEWVEFYDGTAREYMVVPGNPTNGQEWEYFGLLNDQEYKRKIRLVNTNFPINTEDCTYESYIIVDEVSAGTSPSGNDEIITNELYVKGIGFMYSHIYRELTELTLN